MDLEKKRLYHWLPWVIALGVMGLFAIALYYQQLRQEENWQQRLVLQEKRSQEAFLAVQNERLNQVKLLAELVAYDPNVFKLLREAYAAYAQKGTFYESDDQRVQLLKALQLYWDLLDDVHGRELNLYLGPDLIAYLRLNRADRYGDKLSSPLLISAFKDRKAFSGMEIGHFGASYRGGAPVYDTDRPDRQPIAVVEVAISIVNSSNYNPKEGRALLLDMMTAKQILWGDAKQAALERLERTNQLSRWAIESASSSQAKDWQELGLLEHLDEPRTKPWELVDGNKRFLMSVTQLPSYTRLNLTAPQPSALMLSWLDVTDAYNASLAERKKDAFRYLGGWIFCELCIWFSFLLNRRYFMKVLKNHGRQLQQERDLAEQSKHRLTLALVSNSSGFWEWNIADNSTHFSKEWRELLCLPADNNNRTDIEDWLERVHPSDKRASYNDMIRHIKGETEIFENEYRVRVADGSYKWISTRGKVVERTAAGKATLMLGIYTDITDRKKNEIIIVRQQAALRALNDIASIAAIDAEDQLRRALLVGSRYLGLPNGQVSRVQGNKIYFRMRVGQSVSTSFDEENADVLSNYFCELVLRDQTIFCCDEVSLSEFTNHHAYRDRKVESYIGVPIWVKGRVYGTLSFCSDKSRHQEYDSLDKEFAQLLGRWVGVTLERWQHQSEQKTLLNRFDKLCKQLPGFLYQFQINADGSSCFPFASSGIEQIYGVLPEEVSASAEKVFAVLHPQELGWISESISVSAATLTDWTATYRVLHPKRGLIWVRGAARPQRIEGNAVLWHGYIQEITDEKKAALRLQEISNLRETIFDATSTAIISTDPQGLIKSFNHGAEKMLGYSAAEVVDTHTPATFHVLEEVINRARELSKELDREILPGFDVFVAKSREGYEEEREWTYIHKDGSQLPVLLVINCLRDAEGEITGYLGLATDISEMKRVDRMKNEFISTVSHELRTPLTAISGSLGILVGGAAGDIPDTAAKMLNIAHKNSLRLIHLVNDLLDIEKLVAGKMQFELLPQPILPIVLQSVEANAAFAEQYGVTFVVNSQITSQLSVHTDAQRLQQVLTNFLSNAAKFSRVGTQIDIQVQLNGDVVRVSVIDTGPGIPLEFRSRIFQKFSQADSSDSRQKGGSGLGLSICKEIIERMGGKIGFTSEVDKGSEFYFELFVDSAKKIELHPAESASTTIKRLLIVEKDAEVAELFATLLRAENYRVDIVSSGKAALEQIALYKYQALTLDLDLSDMDGISLIKQLRSDALLKGIPIVVIGADTESSQAVKPFDSMFTNVQWLQKPQMTNAIVAAVKTALA